MRVWNINDPEERKKPFEPDAAEIFGVQGRLETRVFAAFEPCPEIREAGCECEFCALGRKRNPVPLCKIGRFLCRPDERSDKRQIITCVPPSAAGSEAGCE